MRAALPPLELESIVVIVTRSTELLNTNPMRVFADKSSPNFKLTSTFALVVIEDLGKLGVAHTDASMLLRLLGST